jgi:hypothetical protein
MIETDLNSCVPCVVVRAALMGTMLILAACVDDADLGEVPAQTDGMGGTEGTQGSSDSAGTEEETEEGTEEGSSGGDTEDEGTDAIGGCQRIEAEGNDEHTWSLICGSAATERLEVLELTESGDTIVGISSGVFRDEPTPSWTFGDTEYTHSGETDAMLLRYDTDGNLLWSSYFAAEGSASLSSLAVCGETIVVAGRAAAGSVVAGDTVLEEGAFVARIAGDGSVAWSQSLAESSRPSIFSLDCDSAGRIGVSGSVEDSVDFGGGSVTVSEADGFVAKYDADGSLLFAKTLLATPAAAGPGQVQPFLALHDDGSTYVHLNHSKAVDFGSGTIVPFNAGTSQGLLARLSETGDLLWPAPVGGEEVFARDVVVDDNGRVAVTGPFLGSVELGGVTYENVFPYEEQELDIVGSNADIYVAVFEADGTYAWGAAAGWMRDETSSIAAFSDDEVLLYRVSGTEGLLSLSTYSATGSVEQLAGEGLVTGGFEGSYSVQDIYGAMRTNDDSAVVGGIMGEYLAWPLDVSPHLRGSSDAIVVHFDR